MKKLIIVIASIVLGSAFIAGIVINVGSWIPVLCDLSWVPQEPLTQLTALVISTTAVAALLTYLREQQKWDLEKQRTRSAFFFDQATKGLDETFSLLCDKNNDRITWIRAARTLLQAIEISKRIDLDEYKEAYRLHAEKVRSDLYLALSEVDEETGGRQSLPSQFFYGLSNYKDFDSLDEAALQASSKIRSSTIVIDRVTPSPSTKHLEPKSVVAIYDFLQFPSDYDDPLSKVEDWEIGFHPIDGIKEGAAQYYTHRKTKPAYNGKFLGKKDEG